MKMILVACEESQRVTIALRELGYEAFSCDIIDPSGGHPEWHIKEDVTHLLDGRCIFETMDGTVYGVPEKWSAIIAFPTCTFLTVTANKYYNEEVYGDAARERKAKREEAVKFFMKIANADCDHIMIENPVGVMSTRWRKPDQIIQPYMFGNPFEKRTCLWMKNIPLLEKQNEVEPPPRQVLSSGKTMPKWYSNCGGNRPKERSKTFPGVARAIAEAVDKALGGCD